MNWKKTMMAFSLGAIAGFFAAQSAPKNSISPEQALAIAKDLFRKKGPISGSWIYMKKEELVKHGITYRVYRGGISRTVNKITTQYNFYIDASTGALIEVTELSDY